jgi:hypothetical protein
MYTVHEILYYGSEPWSYADIAPCGCWTLFDEQENIVACEHCRPCRERLARWFAYLREYVQGDLYEAPPVRPLDVSGVPANGTEAYFRS